MSNVTEEKLANTRPLMRIARFSFGKFADFATCHQISLMYDVTLL